MSINGTLPGQFTVVAGVICGIVAFAVTGKFVLALVGFGPGMWLFAGISLEGSTLRPDNGANKNLYGKDVSAKSIVFNHAVPVPACAKELLATLQKASPVNKSKS